MTLKNNIKIDDNVSVMLDLIRALASQLVVIGHGISFLGLFTFLHYPNVPWMQNIAVVIFFLLSGFLISYVIDNKCINNSNGFAIFLADRFSRIYPPLIIALLFIVILDNASQYYDSSVYRYHDAYNLSTFLANLAMLQDFTAINFGFTSFGSGRPLWTLAVEWWIYMFVGYAFLCHQRIRIQLVYVITVMVLAILPTDYLFEGRGNGLFLTWLLGSLAYLIFKKRYLESLSISSALIILMVFTVALIKHSKGTVGYGFYLSFYLSIVFLITLELSRRAKALVVFKKISAFLASYAYTLYLTHYSIFDLLNLHFEHSVTIFLIGYLISNVVAYYLAKIGELKASRIMKNYLYSKILKSSSAKV